ncbi:RTA1 like protein-domain-containing protein [Cantharellus anzutake]|uniref:RTA1 like protein-domain-containing protein n=1 Tax=Cantharellus anzutake TaxID=1750568 RepID=UPI001906F82B|nr:RTA1 like protein-domain-containing protein [Cantharellus anzutake]KAF8326222.1 RTA1 like protein-domain-containing protein [Cantharellus anzutake]
MSVEPSYTPYGYAPTLWICTLFLALFSLSTIIHLGQALWCRRWYLILTLVLGGIGEIIGWSGRLWSAKNVSSYTAFLVQISTRIFSLTFLSAENFIVLGEIVNRLGPQYSLISARAYAFIFLSVDLVALVGLGGGIASATADFINGDPNIGGHIMLFDAFHWSTPSSMPSEKNPEAMSGREYASLTPRIASMLCGLGINSVLLLIRAVYRTIELSNGWDGSIIQTEVRIRLF